MPNSVVRPPSSNATFRCSYTLTPPDYLVRVTWSHQGLSAKRRLGRNNLTLTITDLTVQDGGGGVQGCVSMEGSSALLYAEVCCVVLVIVEVAAVIICEGGSSWSFGRDSGLASKAISPRAFRMAAIGIGSASGFANRTVLVFWVSVMVVVCCSLYSSCRVSSSSTGFAIIFLSAW